ncbi:MAG TPA: diguanylate cyclase [Noviherbaspirillum sp.]
MSELDPRSLIFVAGLLGLLCSVILFMLRRSFPPTIGGLVYWSRGLFGMVVASVLFGLTDVVPAFFSVVLANAMLVGGIMSFYMGFRHFAGLPTHHRLMGVVLALLVAYVTWFTYVQDSYPARALLVTFTDSVLFFACASLVARTTGKTLAGRFTSIVFAAIGAVSFGRALMLFFQLDTPQDILGSSTTQRTYLAALAFSIVAITLGAMMMANERLRAALEFIASHDQLTGAYGRAAFIELLKKELTRSRRNGQPLALLMFDLDHFKAVNDRFGHATGDRVIIDFVHRTKHLLRSADSIGRYGGEEFVALLPETSTDEARIVAERICKGIAEANAEGLPEYTVSVGLAVAIHGNEAAENLLSRADEALYLAKKNGRNRVEAADMRHSDARSATP